MSNLIPVFMDPPTADEPDHTAIGTLAAMKKHLGWARLYAEWLNRVEIAAWREPRGDFYVEGAVISFAHVLEIILDRWRIYFPDDAPPELPVVAWHGTDAHRAVDAAQRHLATLEQHSDEEFEKMRELIRRALESKTGWEFIPGKFRFNTAQWYDLTTQNLKLLEAFSRDKQHTLTHDAIDNLCSEGYSVSPYNCISRLNKALCKCWKLKEKPIKAVHRSKAYRLYPPS